MPFEQLPAGATLKPNKFTARVSDEALNDFKQTLKYSKIGPKTYENLKEENTKESRYFGISRKWLAESKQYWETGYDWRKTEARINAMPQFHVDIPDDKGTINVHFMALFSQKADAVPLILLHGWPGTFLEFMSVCEIWKSKYTPENFPFNVVVPSLPGYGYSNGPPLHLDYTVEDQARIMDKLMRGLGFSSGYIAQGGDIGSFISRVLAVSHDSCKTCHINLAIGVDQPEGTIIDSLTEVEKRGLAKAQDFGTLGNAYAREHGTRPATIGLVLSSSPIALLAWVGEKYQVWSDTDPTQDEILDSVTLYWFTDSFPRAIFPYRQFFGSAPTFFHNDPKFVIKKPFGYSYFPEELAPMPRSWVAATGDLAWYKEHTEGGHFAALEKPKLFVEDLEEFTREIWPKVK